MTPVKFLDIREDLLSALKGKLTSSPIPNEAGFSLVEGFMTSPLQTEISTNIVIGGQSVPMVGVVGNTSGRIYLFALKVVMPGLWKE